MATDGLQLNDLQRLILQPVAATLRRHRRGQPVTIDGVVAVIEIWLSIFDPRIYNDWPEKKRRRDIERTIQYLRTGPRSTRMVICSHGRGMYVPDDPGEIQSYIEQLESRIRAIALNMRCAKTAMKNMILREGLPDALQPNIFDAQMDRVDEYLQGPGNTPLKPSPESPHARVSGGGTLENYPCPGRKE